MFYYFNHSVFSYLSIYDITFRHLLSTQCTHTLYFLFLYIYRYSEQEIKVEYIEDGGYVDDTQG